MIKPVSLPLAAVLLGAMFVAAQDRTPQSVSEDLLAADRAFSQSSAKTDLVSGLSAMFSDDVTLAVPSKLVQGKAAAVDALRANPDSLKTHMRWMPKRVGISGDGEHGFTFGFFMTEAPDGKKSPGKYLAYWVKGRAGWRVAAYKRGRATGDAPVSLALMAPSLPAKLVAPSSDAATIKQYCDSLTAAEGAFSKDAQSIGLGPAFAKHGSADAINLGGPSVPEFIVGNDAIGKFIGAGSPEPQSPVSWGADRVLVASSGDLGVTFGLIRQNAPAAGASGPQSFPFFTIWYRATPSAPWKYIAE